MATSLTSEECTSVAMANELFSSQEGLLVLTPRRTCQNPFSFTIPSGCYALVTCKGIDVDYIDENRERCAIWPPGLHFPYPPWYQISHLVTKQSAVFEVPVMACKTRNNVNVDIHVGLTFRIMGDTSLGEDSFLVRKFVKELNPLGLEQQLRGAVQASLRSLIRSMDHSAIYGIRNQIQNDDRPGEIDEGQPIGGENMRQISSSSTRSFRTARSTSGSLTTEPQQIIPFPSVEEEGGNFIEQLRENLNDQFLSQGVQILSLVFKNVTLPFHIQSQLSSKVVSQRIRDQDDVQHLDDMQQADMEGEMSSLLQSFDESRKQELQVSHEKLNIEKLKLEYSIAQTRKAEAEICEEARVRIESIREKQSYDVQKVKDVEEAETTKTELNSKTHSAKLKGDTELNRQLTLSEAYAESEKNSAESDMIMASAEGKISKWIKKRNEYTLELQKIRNLESLSGNEDVIFSPSTDTDENVMVVAESISRSHDGTPSVATVAAEMEILKRAGVAVVTPEKEQGVERKKDMKKQDSSG
mmetsp:Transcript_3118/g.4157  ORF Transcript_3118/g.4157 Transcript_3118/m.4157 type:complete len:527 (+) Transcript_3118:219-1799(+)